MAAHKKIAPFVCVGLVTYILQERAIFLCLKIEKKQGPSSKVGFTDFWDSPFVS
ncbi:hypothetical protein [Bacillus xiapuensis]|uniref:hypothetical protein n=1 Tax=Bacillus xiapuensis TaxID=2014075 RepID=UPI0018E2086B|nr:hypothetical protein [Bacillus xiapuensis]